MQSIKRLFDLIIAASMIVVLLPLLLIAVLIIGLDGKNPIFSHIRVGKNGGTFRCYKFRTMLPNADALLQQLLSTSPSAKAEWEKEHKLKQDPRITRFGAILRRTSFDEIPQLWNVIVGDMSLVGPRPITEQEMHKYGGEIVHYLSVKPGITGLWQVSGRNETSYPQRVALDTYYVTHWSFFLDLIILFKTISVVIVGKGAY